MAERTFYAGAKRGKYVVGYAPAKFLMRDGTYVVDPMPTASRSKITPTSFTATSIVAAEMLRRPPSRTTAMTHSDEAPPLSLATAKVPRRFSDRSPS